MYDSNRFEDACWTVSGNLEIVGSARGPVLQVRPTNDSTSIGDSTINLKYISGGTESMSVTIRRPKYVGMAFTTQPHFTDSRVNVGVNIDYSFKYQIVDQFYAPFFGTMVNEIISGLDSYNTMPSPVVTRSGTTDANGIIPDGRTVLFYPGATSGYSLVEQSLIIGEHTATVFTRISFDEKFNITFWSNAQNYPVGFH